MTFERPKVSQCKDCKKPIEWKEATNGSGKRWPFDMGGTPHFQTCENKKPFIAKCKFCQAEIEWKDRKPMDLDGKSHFETCTARKLGASVAPEEPLF